MKTHDEMTEIVVDIRKYLPEKEEEPTSLLDSPAVRFMSRLAGYSLIFGGSLCFVGSLIASPWLGIDSAFKGFAIFVGFFTLGWLCFPDRFYR
jgi:hypothetical protein